MSTGRRAPWAHLLTESRPAAERGELCMTRCERHPEGRVILGAGVPESGGDAGAWRKGFSTSASYHHLGLSVTSQDLHVAHVT